MRYYHQAVAIFGKFRIAYSRSRQPRNLNETKSVVKVDNEFSNNDLRLEVRERLC